jgi:hypothetical protein
MAPERHARAFFVAASVVFAGMAHGAEPASAAPTDERFASALAAYERNHWNHAYAQLAALADDGHAEAARMALQMWRHGPALYRTDFAASARQVERWTRVWGCSGDSAATACTRASLQTP